MRDTIRPATKQEVKEYLSERAASKAQVSEQSLFDELLNRVNCAVSHASAIAHNIEAHGSRLFGELQTDTDHATDAVRVSADGLVDHLLLALNTLDQQLHRISSAHTRISKV